MSGTNEIREIIPKEVFTHSIIGEIIKKINDSNISNLDALLDSDLSATARDMVSGLIIENIEISRVSSPNPRKTSKKKVHIFSCFQQRHFDNLLMILILL